MTTTTIDAERALTPEGFTEVLRDQLEREIKVYPARAWYPSQIGHPCDRYLVWRFTRWQEQRRHDWVLQAIFDEGNTHQPAVYRRLDQMGFDVVREHDRPTQYTVGGAVISGRPDGKLRGFRGERFSPLRLLEIKTTQGHTFDRLATIEDVKAAPQHYVRGYADQGYLYGFLENLPQGVIVLKAKNTGLLKVIPFDLDFDRAESLLKRIERLQPMVEQQIDPEPIPYDGGICGGCPFNHLCYPARSFGAGAAVLEDSALIEDLETRERLKPAHAEYEDVDRSIKTRLKREGVTLAVAGPFQIEATERQVKGYEVKPRVDRVYTIRRVEALESAQASPAA